MTSKIRAQYLLRGLTFESLPDGWTPIAATMVVKCLDPKGRPFWVLRSTDDMNGEEILGALLLRTELQRQSMLEDYSGEDE